MKYIIAILPLIIGFILDLIIGDPYSMPHPVRLIGRLISSLEKIFRKLFSNNLLLGGTLLSLTVLTLSTVSTALLLYVCYSINQWLGAGIESILIYYTLAAKCLYNESILFSFAIRIIQQAGLLIKICFQI